VRAGYTTLSASEAAEVIAPDGSSVLPLCVLLGAASFACFELKPWQVSQSVSHATAVEIGYIISGSGKSGAVHTGELFGIAPTGRETEVRTHDFHETWTAGSSAPVTWRTGLAGSARSGPGHPTHSSTEVAAERGYTHEC
jgi:hypothetical protein